MSELPAFGEVTTDRSARVRAWVASILTVVSAGTLVAVFILAPVPGLAGLILAASGIGKDNPYRTLNRMLLVICALVVVASIMLSLLLIAV